MRIALTCDDAPTIAAQAPFVAADPQRMDRVRIALRQRGVEHCVAFVIGAHGVDDAPLRRWLDAGYELGNHTWEHAPTSGRDPAEFARSVQRCHELLVRVGAFARGQPQWFRFPYLDYGRDHSEQRAAHEALVRLGYRVAHATVDLHDDRFEAALGRAGQSETRTEIIGWRYRATARRCIDEARTRWPRATPQIPYFHFGGVSTRFIGDIVGRLIDEGATLCSLGEALAHPALRRTEGTGLLLGPRQRPLAERVLDRGRGLANRVDPTDGHWLGPLWPRHRTR